jgi:hypothetical protein
MPLEEQRFWFRRHRLPTWVAFSVTLVVALGICASGLLFHHSALVLLLASVFVWIAVRIWLTDVSILIDAQEGVICRRDRWLGILKVDRVVGLKKIVRLVVRAGKSPWWTWLTLGFGPEAAAYELVAQMAEGESIVIWEYGAGFNEQALAEGLRLSQWLGLPLVEAILGRERQVGQTNLGYVEALSQAAMQDLPSRPTAARAQCEVGQELIVRMPRPRLTARQIPWLVVFPLAIAGLAVLSALAANRMKEWLVWALFGGGMALVICLWTMWQALRKRVTLTVSPQALTCQVQCGSTFTATQIETAALRDVTVVRNGGPVAAAALWLGRQAVCFFHEDQSLAFGLGLEMEELLWIKQAIDWVLSGRPMEDVARAAAGRGREIIFPAEDEPESQSMFPQPAGPSAIRRTVRMSFGVAACYLAIMAGISLTWLITRPQADSGPAAITAPASREDFQEVQRMMNTPEVRMVREAQERAAREGRPLRDVLLETLRGSSTTRPATAPATESVNTNDQQSMLRRCPCRGAT